jgi:hypothetical protein
VAEKRTVPTRDFKGLFLPVALEATFSGHPGKQTLFTRENSSKKQMENTRTSYILPSTATFM